MFCCRQLPETVLDPVVFADDAPVLQNPLPWFSMVTRLRVRGQNCALQRGPRCGAVAMLLRRRDMV